MVIDKKHILSMIIVNKIDCYHNLYFTVFVLDDIYLFIADGGSIFQTLFSTSFSDVQKSHYHMDHTIYSRWRGGYNSSTFNISSIFLCAAICLGISHLYLTINSFLKQSVDIELSLIIMHSIW